MDPVTAVQGRRSDEAEGGIPQWAWLDSHAQPQQLDGPFPLISQSLLHSSFYGNHTG